MRILDLPIFFAPDDPPSDPPPANDPPSDPPAFNAITTQEQFDRVVGSLLTKEREKFGDYAGLKEKASKFDELEAASKTELEKEREARAASDKRAVDAETKARGVAAKADVFAAAVTMSIVDAEAAYALIRESITFDEAGNPTNIEELLKELTEKKPYLVGQSPGPGSGGGGARQDQAGASSGGGWIRDGFKN